MHPESHFIPSGVSLLVGTNIIQYFVTIRITVSRDTRPQTALPQNLDKAPILSFAQNLAYSLSHDNDGG